MRARIRPAECDTGQHGAGHVRCSHMKVPAFAHEGTQMWLDLQAWRICCCSMSMLWQDCSVALVAGHHTLQATLSQWPRHHASMEQAHTAGGP